jgi:carbon-monoxide dehydrogenase small subunit
MNHDITLIVNGERHQLKVSSNRTLIQVLREDLELKGTKEGCGTGECGACTVLVDGESVNSCLYLAALADGAEILTIEGLEKHFNLHPLQAAFLDSGAVQCGYCTPGMIMQALALLRDNPHPTEDEIRMGLEGNLCRCTGYVKIVEAILCAAKNREDIEGNDI